MKIKPFGLDIGITTMKAVWFSEGKDGLLLNSSAILPTPPKGMISESPIDQEEMAKGIRKIVEEAKITTPYVNAALPENQVYTRILEMPPLSDKELSSAIYWEVEQYIPVPLTSLTVDWKVLKRPANQEEGKMEVLLVGAPIALIDKYQKIFSMAGLSISSLETEVLSVVRALVPRVKQGNSSFPNSLIVHLGAVSTSLAIVRSGTIVFTYSISTGGSSINRAIAADFGFSASQAEEYKKAYGVSQDSLDGKIGKAATPILMSIITEIKKALAFYSEKYKNDFPIAQILLSGGTAKLPGIDLFFAKNLGIESAIANPWLVLSNQQVPKDILENAPDYTIAVGLAQKDYE